MQRPSIEGYAVISKEGMIATSDGKFPEQIKIPADHKFYQDSVAAASAVANGRHSAEGGIGEKHRKRIILTRRVDIITPDPGNPNAVLWNPATAPFEEAWARLGIDGGTLAVVGGTDTFGLFLSIGYDVFYLTKTDASLARGRPVFPGVGTTTTAEAEMTKHGLVLNRTRMLDSSVNCRVEEWVKK
jgi:dihydrofolate reductase